MNRDEVLKAFLHDIREHSMEVKLDNGVYRHLTFTRNKSNIYRFDLITYPGHLVVSGDMGTYVFQRLEDMFCFFRDNELRVNPGYWGEKLEAVSKQSGYMEFSLDKYKDIIKELVDQHVQDEDLSDAQADELWEEIDEELLYWVETEEQAFQKSEGFEAVHGFKIQDFWEYNCREYTYHYLWILYAIVWGIQQYDNK